MAPGASRDRWAARTRSPLRHVPARAGRSVRRSPADRLPRCNSRRDPGGRMRSPHGLAEMEETVVAGIGVNMTLQFPEAHHLQAAEAYLRALERRLAPGRDVTVPSVASIFVSRWDKAADPLLPGHQHGTLGLAVAPVSPPDQGHLRRVKGASSLRCEPTIENHLRRHRPWRDPGRPRRPQRRRGPAPRVPVPGALSRLRGISPGQGPPAGALHRPARLRVPHQITGVHPVTRRRTNDRGQGRRVRHYAFDREGDLAGHQPRLCGLYTGSEPTSCSGV